MFGSATLDVAIGIMFVYLLLSLFCSTLNEFISRVFAMRSSNLEEGIRNMLNDPEHEKEVIKQVEWLLGGKIDDTIANVKKQVQASGSGSVEVAALVAERIRGLGGKDLAKIESEIKKLGDEHGAQVEAAVRAVLDPRTVTEKLYAHPLVKGLYHQGLVDRFIHGFNRLFSFISREGKPSYISSRSFALALLDIAVPQGQSQTVSSVKSLADNIAKSNAIGEDAKKALLTLVDTTQEKIETSRKNIETWFNEGMERVSGWYKRKTQLIVFLLAVIVTAVLNADTLTIAKILSADPTVRDLVASTATEFVKATLTAQAAAKTATPAAVGAPPASATVTITSTQGISTTLTNLNNYRTELLELPLPFGWCIAPEGPPVPDILKFLPNCSIPKDPHRVPMTPYEQLSKLLGLYITMVAISLGAPFWFDLLSKLVNLRASGSETKKEPEPTRQEPQIPDSDRRRTERPE